MPLFSIDHSKGKILALSQKLRQENKCNGENPSKSEVIGRCDGDEKTEWPRRTDKSRTLKKMILQLCIIFYTCTMEADKL